MTVVAVFKEHKIVFSLRIIVIIFAIVGCCIYGWAFPQHEYVYTDGIGALYEMLPLIGVYS
jgi:hypothetical protein